MKHTLLSIVAAAALISGTACSDTSSIGNSLADETLTIVVDSAFTVTGATVENPVVASRTISQLIGSVDAPGFGKISSDFVAQFMPSAAIDTADFTIADIDSLTLFMQMQRGAFTGDSLVPMGLEVYRLKKDLPYPIYSDFDPAGYYESRPLCSAIYTASTKNEPDSVKKLSTIVTRMPMPVTLARELYQAYLDDPSVYSDPTRFADEVFKGIYVRSSYGSGRITDFTTTSMRLFYHKTTYNTDSARYETKNYYGDYYAVAPEVIVNNNIKFDIAPELLDMAAAGEHIIAAPAGLEVDIRFPAPEILASYNKYKNDLRVLNTLTFTIPADSISNTYGIAPPPYLLMVLKNKKSEFFANNSINDDVTSFYAAYNESTRSYTFQLMRNYLLDLLKRDQITPDDYTFTLCPVQVYLEMPATGGYYGSDKMVVSSIVPYVSKPVMTKISLKDAKIKLTFSAQNNKNL
ncbi:MAG: DUF4270 family protein [Bacteroidales bacterium]|nr:DUF4270 family protein [Bacteroidales bacterium]